MAEDASRIGRHFTLESVGNAFETGYEVTFLEEGEKPIPRIQFRVLIDSGMNLVPVVSRVYGRATAADVQAAKEIVGKELAERPSVFHVVENGFRQMKVHDRAVRYAPRLLPENDPLLEESRERITALDAIIKEARKWSHDPKRGPFKEFMAARSMTVERPGFAAGPFEGIGEGPCVHPAMGPIELLYAASRADPRPSSVVVIQDAAFLTRVRASSGLGRSSFDWPRPDDQQDGVPVRWAHTYELHPELSPDIRSAMSGDAVVVAWTSQTENAAFESFLGRFAKWDLDPKVVLGSPEGTFVGRAGALREAFAAARAEKTAEASGPTLGMRA